VVAGEVRTLAQRSAAAAKEIKDLITAASKEQSSGISQVGDAVSQLDQATQQNAALVEESTAAAESLKLQAARLIQVVGVFKLSDRAA